jgi:hypothetical protein
MPNSTALVDRAITKYADLVAPIGLEVVRADAIDLLLGRSDAVFVHRVTMSKAARGGCDPGWIVSAGRCARKNAPSPKVTVLRHGPTGNPAAETQAAPAAVVDRAKSSDVMLLKQRADKMNNLVAQIGLEAIRRDAIKRMAKAAKTKCGRGWVMGPNGKCVRPEKKLEEEKPAAGAPRSTVKPDIAGKIRGHLNQKGIDLSKVDPEKIKASLRKHPQLQGLDAGKIDEIALEVAGGKPAVAKQPKPKLAKKGTLAPPDTSSADSFDLSDGVKSLKKDWADSIKEGSKYAKYRSQQFSIELIDRQISRVSRMPDGARFNIQEIVNEQPKTVQRTKEERFVELNKQKEALTKSAAKLGKQINTEASADRVSDALEIIDDLTSHARKKGVVSGSIGVGGRPSAAFAYSPKEDHLYLDFLVSDPKNMYSKGGAKGAGKAALKEIASRSVKAGKGGKVKLFALDGAVGFYEKMGFVRDGEDDNHMTLSPEAAKKLLGD